MARPNVFSTETKLWHAAEGWRKFPAGETDPGGAWSEQEGGNPVGNNATAGALKDLIEANDRLDAAAEREAKKDHDLATMAAERDAANGKVADLNQRAIAAEKSQAEAEANAASYAQERSRAVEDLAVANRRIAALEAQVAAFDGDGDGKVGGSRAKPAT